MTSEIKKYTIQVATSPPLPKHHTTHSYRTATNVGRKRDAGDDRNFICGYGTIRLESDGGNELTR